MFCSLLLLITVGTAHAQETYERMDYPTVVEPTIDGTWTSTDEWTDGLQTNVTDDFVFRSTWSMLSQSPITVVANFIVEILDDETADTGDYWEFCIDSDQSGGTVPMVGDFKLYVDGDTDLTLYEGDGTTWNEVTPDAGAINFSSSIDDSPVSSTAHRIIEFQILKTGTVPNMGATWNFRLAVYDESNSAAGVQSWPPDSDADVPDEWGIQNYSSDPIPEGFTFAVMIFLSSVSLLVGSHYLQKRSKKQKQ
jgi:hypothetical protein